MRLKLDVSAGSLRALLLPRRCVLCHAPSMSNMDDLCSRCHAALPWLIHACPTCALPRPDASPCPRCTEQLPPQDAAWAVFRFAEPVHQAILALKYGAGFAQARWLGHALAGAFAARQRARPDCLLPVPLHVGRLRRRGYNQALELARVISRDLDIAVDYRAVRRVRATADQIGQSRAARRRNLRGAFSASSAIEGMHVALVDDVMTTGSTLAELARCCKAAGAARVETWAIARA